MRGKPSRMVSMPMCNPCSTHFPPSWDGRPSSLPGSLTFPLPLRCFRGWDQDQWRLLHLESRFRLPEYWETSQRNSSFTTFSPEEIPWGEHQPERTRWVQLHNEFDSELSTFCLSLDTSESGLQYDYPLAMSHPKDVDINNWCWLACVIFWSNILFTVMVNWWRDRDLRSFETNKMPIFRCMWHPRIRGGSKLLDIHDDYISSNPLDFEAVNSMGSVRLRSGTPFMPIHTLSHSYVFWHIEVNFAHRVFHSDSIELLYLTWYRSEMIQQAEVFHRIKSAPLPWYIKVLPVQFAP